MLTIEKVDFLANMEDRLRSHVQKAVDNFDRLPKEGRYQIAFSGGKDSTALLAIYSLYLKLGGHPLDLIVVFADTHLEALDLYQSIDKAKKYCELIGVPFVAVLFFADGNIIYEGCFNLLKFNYNKAEDEKSGSLRMGCAFCPVVSVNTIAANVKSGVIPPFALRIREILERMRNARRIGSYRSTGKGAIYIEDRRLFWKEVRHYQSFLLEYGWITPRDIARIEHALEIGQYPPTYPQEWIDAEHTRLERNPFYDLPLFKDL